MTQQGIAEVLNQVLARLEPQETSAPQCSDLDICRSYDVYNGHIHELLRQKINQIIL